MATIKHNQRLRLPCVFIIWKERKLLFEGYPVTSAPSASESVGKMKLHKAIVPFSFYIWLTDISILNQSVLDFLAR